MARHHKYIGVRQKKDIPSYVQCISIFSSPCLTRRKLCGRGVNRERLLAEKKKTLDFRSCGKSGSSTLTVLEIDEERHTQSNMTNTHTHTHTHTPLCVRWLYFSDECTLAAQIVTARASQTFKTKQCIQTKTYRHGTTPEIHWCQKQKDRSFYLECIYILS